MLKIGLTGGIGMGKSTICAMFKELKIPVFSADEIVHELYRKNGQANISMKNEFGDITNENGDIDREKLSKLIITDPLILKKIEQIVHPLVKKSREDFIENSKKNNSHYVIIDIPLLFETNSQNEFDKIILVDCDFETQKQRVLSRPNMTEAKFNAILAKQFPNSQKKPMVDFIIDTSKSLEESQKQIIQIDKEIKKLAKNA